MTREWKPGDVAMVRLDPETEIRVIYNGACWVGRKGTFYDLHASARPLAVIDYEDREQVERLARGYERDPNPGQTSINDMQAALREFANPTPPKPPEPTELGAVVIDVDGVRWVRNGSSGYLNDPNWRAANGPCGSKWRLYSEINVRGDDDD